MTLEEAIDTLERSSSQYDLAMAIGTLMILAEDRCEVIPELLKGLRHPGFVASQAAMALYVRLGIPRPDFGDPLEIAPDILWAKRVDDWLGRWGDTRPAGLRTP